MRLIDTNILVHAVDDSSPKQERAQTVLSYYMGTGRAVVSRQSVAELYSALTKAASPKQASLAAERVLETEGFKKIPVDKVAVSEALSLAGKNNLRRSEIFDALLAATAKRNGVGIILTENPKHFERLGMEVETLDTATA